MTSIMHSPILTPKEFKNRMAGIYGGEFSDYYDEERTHIEADELMLELLESLGYDEGVAIFNRARQWYA